jgi:hypothetical protein
VIDQSPTGNCFARRLRLGLAREHLDRVQGADADLHEPVGLFTAFAETARVLDAWHAGGCAGPRPPGRLRTYRVEPLSRLTRLWALPMYHLIYDPDGRPPALRRRGAF